MKKIGLICLALVMALGALGVGYAMWDKTLFIEGTVNTGEVNALWTSAFNFDGPGEKDLNFDGSRKDKDVGETIVTGVGTQTLVITILNGYPCYFNDIEYHFQNTGTVPVKIQSITLTPLDFTLASAMGADDGELWVVFYDGIGSQLEPGDTATGSFLLHVEQCAAELETYTFTVEVLLVQWNEYIP